MKNVNFWFELIGLFGENVDKRMDKPINTIVWSITVDCKNVFVKE